MKKKSVFKQFMIFSLVILLTTNSMMADAQSVMPLPSHGNVYSGNSRGFWFTAPIGFVITGVRAPLEINSNAQSIHLVKFTAGPPPAYSSVTTSFTTLFYGSNIAGTTFVSMNIQVDSGDVIGVIAVRNNGSGGSQTSYATPVGPYLSYIGTYPVTITRMGWQGNIISSPAANFWQEAAGAVGRAEIQYVLSQPTDAGLESFINVPDSICSGINPVTVSLKNFGPNSLSEVKINWKINNVVQPVYTWSGSLAVNASSNVTIGTYSFQNGITYDILAWVSDVNNDVDSVPTNDTIQKTGIVVKPSPGVTLNDTAFTICQGDSAQIIGQFSGSPPWNMTLHDGTSAIQFNNITTPGFGLWVSPSNTITYTIIQISDATGCASNDSLPVIVSVVPQPPSVITPMGATAACTGDSVTLMASIGLNFTYQWMKDGIPIPGAANYVLAAKQPGAYTVEVTSPNGCSTVSPPVNVIIHPLPSIFLGNDTNIAPGLDITLDAGPGFTSYLWSTNATSQTITVDTAGHGLGIQTIWVEVRDNNYCPGRDTIKVNFVHNPGIAESVRNSNVYIVPNPNTGKFQLQLSSFPESEILLELFGHDGRKVFEQNLRVQHATEKILIDAGNVPDGLYILRITGNAGSFVKKLVVNGN